MGGIDFNPNGYDINVNGDVIKMNPSVLDELHTSMVEGITPVIINITFIENINRFFGESSK